MKADTRCPRCGIECRFKSALITHMNRIKPCEPLLSDIDPQTFRSELAEKDKADKKYICRHCSKGFINRKSKYEHQRNCKGSTELVPAAEVQQLANTVVSLQAQVAELTAQSKIRPSMINNTTNNNTQNNNIHIHVTPRDFARGENNAELDETKNNSAHSKPRYRN
jgi:hypothetical protein